MSEARAWIMGRLRDGLADPEAAFKAPGQVHARQGPPTPLTTAEGDPRALAARFGSELDGVLGSHEVVEDVSGVVERVLVHIEALREADSSGDLSFEIALAWSPEALRVPGLEERMARDGTRLMVPDDLHDPVQRRDASRAAVGITSVDAALASTGTMVMLADAGRSRAASLLPLHHIALVPRRRIHATAESWIALLRREGELDATLRDGSQLTFITGPSKSADIELTLTLGVHGPKTVHAIVYQD